MKIHTTNYLNTFIEIAEDCSVNFGEMPPLNDKKKSAAYLQFDLISNNPYMFTSDDVLFQVYVVKNELTKSDLNKARLDFFSKGQPCLRASPLSKRYGWGFHFDSDSKVAIYGCDTIEYKNFSKENSLKHFKAMKSSK